MLLYAQQGLHHGDDLGGVVTSHRNGFLVRVPFHSQPDVVDVGGAGGAATDGALDVGGVEGRPTGTLNQQLDTVRAEVVAAGEHTPLSYDMQGRGRGKIIPIMRWLDW